MKKIIFVFNLLFIGISTTFASTLDKNWAVTSGLKSSYDSTVYITSINKISFNNNDACLGTYTDVSLEKDSSIMLCNYNNELTFQSNSVIKFPVDSSYLFAAFSNAVIDFNNYVDTSSVKDMSNMFVSLGYNIEGEYYLDLKSFNTLNVTDLTNTFNSVGYKASKVNIDVSLMNTKNVVSMNNTFSRLGYKADEINIIGLDKWDTSSTTNMSFMFNYTGYNADNFQIDVSNFDTSSTLNFSNMFAYAGGKSTNWDIGDINFDTHNAASLKGMFDHTKASYLDLSSFNTTNVLDYSNMFSNCTNLKVLDISSFNYNLHSNSTDAFKNVNNLEMLSLGINNYIFARGVVSVSSYWYDNNKNLIDTNNLEGNTYYAYPPYKIIYQDEDGNVLKTDYKVKGIDYNLNIFKDSTYEDVETKFDTDGGLLLDSIISKKTTSYEVSGFFDNLTKLDNIYKLDSDLLVTVKFNSNITYEYIDLGSSEKEGYTFSGWSFNGEKINNHYYADDNRILLALWNKNPDTLDNIFVNFTIVCICVIVLVILLNLVKNNKK